ncbi:MAG: Re/Si-specific NAD(P)(+) transhydrogenase subunit alpha [Pirellulaceae bacterium]|nr:Re/Si-specific NAD(P)(+) transhydrogenase subunit alpha [Pirellulaceae bacterium]
MRVAVVKELLPGERRVALAPASVPPLIKAGMEVIVQAGAGASAGFADGQYTDKGASIVPDRAAAYQADIVLQVRAAGANKAQGLDDRDYLRANQILIATCDPLGEPQSIQEIGKSGISLFSLELIPRITRAQSMDVLSSQATIAGYRAVLTAAMELDKILPMMMTAAGTLPAAKVFIIGVGVAGLQAIASARKLGAVVSAYDVRPACREQVESLGAKFVELKLDNAGSEDKGGYAKAMDEEFYRKQGELLASVVAQSDIVITTAAIPGKKSPLLLTDSAIDGMQRGSVVIDLAAERGGNCKLTKADERVDHNGVIILGPTNIASEIPQHASLMFSNNVTKFLLNLVKKGQVEMNMEDEIIRETLVTKGGEVVLPRVRELLGLSSLSS